MNNRNQIQPLIPIVTPLTPEEFPNEQLFQWLLQPRVPVLFSEEPKALQLIRASLRGQNVRFVYFGGSAAGVIRHVSPAFLFMSEQDQMVYLQAFCHERQANRIFRLDRIESEFLFN